MNKLLRRKVDAYLLAWKSNPDRKPLIIKGARQIGKTVSIECFARQNYKHVIQVNFVEQKRYKDIFNDGFNGKLYTFPYFLTFLLKRFIGERKHD